MPYRSMSLEEFAQLVGMNPRDVQRDADHGRLPGRKVGGKWRFNRIQAHDWLEARLSEFDQQRLHVLDRNFGASQPQDEALMITDLMGAESISLDLPAKTRSSVLRELTRLAENTELVYDAKELHDALREREETGSTAFPKGFAIPHPQQPMPYTTAEPLLCLGRVNQGIAFGGPDGSLTYLFFLICSHEHNAHLHVLARLMRLLTDDVLSQLMEVEDPADALQLLIERERQVVASM